MRFFYVPYNIYLLMCFKESRRFFFLYDCYVLGHHRSSKYNYQKMFFYIWHIYFNRKFTSDCPVRHLWNRPWPIVLLLLLLLLLRTYIPLTKYVQEDRWKIKKGRMKNCYAMLFHWHSEPTCHYRITTAWKEHFYEKPVMKNMGQHIVMSKSKAALFESNITCP